MSVTRTTANFGDAAEIATNEIQSKVTENFMVSEELYPPGCSLSTPILLRDLED